MKLRFREVAEKVGILNAKQLAKETGLSVTSCYQLWNGTAKAISFESLNRLCNVLKAGPAIVLDYTPDVDSSAGDPEPANEAQPKVTRPKATRAPSKAKTLAASVTAV
jgi:DNA-binding Xre family transcriptional regulator